MNNNMALMIGENEPLNLFQPFLVSLNDNTLVFIKEYIKKSLDSNYSNLREDQKALAKSINNKLQECDTLVKVMSHPDLYIEEVPILNL